MKKTFLEQSAEHIFERHQHDLERVTVVLPTNRACYFFKRALALQTEQPIWSPRIVPVDDFIAQAAEAELIDPIQLLWLLFDTCRETDPNVQFDRFTSWAYTLLQDFDHVDQYLVDTRQLFEYLSEAKTIERWQPDLANNIPAPTDTLRNYFKLWDNLQDVYRRLKAKLCEQGKGYRGMLYRYIAENPEVLLGDEAVSQYVFVGFNALSRSEEQILARLVKEGKGEVLWDTDDYYMDANLNVKAGDALRHYRDSGRFGPWNWQTHNLMRQPKDVYIIGVPNVTLQARVAMHIHREQLLAKQAVKANGQIQMEFEEADAAAGMTAIVLPDENLLLPLLNSLPAEIKDFNVTMGLALKNSGLYTLVEALFELHHFTVVDKADKSRTPKFSHRYVAKVLRHPFVRQYDYVFQSQQKAANVETPGLVYPVMQQIAFHNKIFFTAQELADLGENHPFFATLFTPWSGESEVALACFYELVEHLRSVYQDRKDALEIEYLFLFRQMVQRLDDIMRERATRPGAEKLSLRSFRLFLNELFRQTKIPFSGEPVSDLQIMGMLETRTLDFDTVILLSANENTLPQGKKQQSMIPFDAAAQFGLPTYRAQEAVMSYHFYRLLQQPQRVYLLYTLPSEANKSEKSRFIQQIENELVRYNPNIRLHYPVVQVLENDLADVLIDYEVPKTDEVQVRIRERLLEGLYPSHINTFVECSMKYYLAHVLQLRAEEETGENLDAGQFGDLVHKTLESMDREMAERQAAVEKQDLEKLLGELPDRVRREFENAYPEYSTGSGYNHMMYKVATQLIGNFFKRLIEENEFPLEVLGIEKEITADYHTFVHGDPVVVRLTGRIDRIDRVNGRLRVIDYKTGKVEKKHLKVNGADQEELMLHDNESGKIRQLWFYKYLVAKRMTQEKGLRLANQVLPLEQNTLVAGIYSFRNLKEGLLEDQLQMGEGTPESFVKHSEEYLQKMLHQILDPAQPFTRTANLKLCTNCGYKRICGR